MSKTLYLDVDEVVLNSIQAMCEMLNKLFDKDLTEKDIHTWNFEEYGDIGSDFIEAMFDLPLFFEVVRFNPSIFPLLTKAIYHGYKVVFVTKGGERNRKMKEQFIHDYLGGFLDYEYEFIGMDINTSKNTVDMSDGVFIDDNENNLFESNAKRKILCVNNPNSNWNSKWDGEWCYKNKLHALDI